MLTDWLGLIDSRFHIPDLVAGPNRPILKQAAHFLDIRQRVQTLRKPVIRG